jgi:hypothetical protein
LGKKDFGKYILILRKKLKIVEIGGIKYGYYDILEKPHYNNDNIIAENKHSVLYKKNNDIYYKNNTIKINIKLKKQDYTDKIDYKRLQIFEINAFFQIQMLKDSLKIPEYKPDGQAIKEDYIYYRDHIIIPMNYEPIYKRQMYEYKK